MGAYTKSLRSYQLAERDSLLRQRRCAVALAKRLASHTGQSPVDTTVLTIGACVDTTGATVGAAVDTTSRSASSHRAITSGSRVARRILVVNANSSALSILALVSCETCKFHKQTVVLSAV